MAAPNITGVQRPAGRARTAARRLGDWRDRALAVLFPPVCLACRCLEGHQALELGLCSACHGRLEPLAHGGRGSPARACAGCGVALAGAALPAGYLCGACRRRPPEYEQLLAGWSYAPPFDAVIHGLKFGRLAYLGEHLARGLARRFGPADGSSPGRQLAGIDLVVPVPLHWRRRLSRGYNQAEEVARPLARRLGLPVARVLRRRRATRPQSGLDRRGRKANLKRAFRAVRKADLRGRAVLLVDDVVTTGSTVRAAASSLRDVGAGRIVVIAAGRTPASGHILAKKVVIDDRERPTNFRRAGQPRAGHPFWF